AVKLHTVGKPLPGVELRIVAPDGIDTPSGEPGEIWVRSRSAMAGYVGGGDAPTTTGDWLRTGDLGRLDDDGFLFYHGRSDDMFKVSGATVFPTEVEQALRDIDGVDNAFVTNLAGGRGDHVGAAVVCDTAATTAEKLRASARTVLSSFKVPTVWLLVDSDDMIPRGPTGKVDVRRLRELLAATDSAQPG
ncbi:MAG TPA: fatty acid--CoA ligase family protein, partial [Mycobacterium sp.]|uniref:class I adenylate-forming enzyme family protein n=1 Tax=Mycobacterium sp. TaxID=1785 RepID=UPI002B92AAF8